MTVHIFGGQTAPSGTEKKTEAKRELKDYFLIFKITDRQMKPRNKDFTKTTERVSWEEEVEVNEATSEVNAILGATFGLSRSFPAKQYDIDCISIKEKMIKVPKLLLP